MSPRNLQVDIILWFLTPSKVGANTTRIEYYGPSKGFETMIKAIKGWASGKNVGCPDLTK